jgi:hypothetical protein
MAKKVVTPHRGKISLLSNMKANSLKEEQAKDHPGHLHEYIFKQVLADFQWEMFELMLDGYHNPDGDNGDLLFLAPRNHAKTSDIETFAVWCIGVNTSELCQFICSNASKSVQRLSKIEDVIRFNGRYKNLFGDLYPYGNPDYVWKSDAMEVVRDKSRLLVDGGSIERDPTLVGFGIDTSVEGGRATRQFYDDVVSMKNVGSEITRKHVSDKFWMSFEPMLQPEGQRIVIGTRYHYADLYAELLPIYDTEGIYKDAYLDMAELHPDVMLEEG